MKTGGFGMGDRDIVHLTPCHAPGRVQQGVLRAASSALGGRNGTGK